MSEEFKKHYQKTKEILDSISPTFCAAKWKQVTMHLHNGHTHSCHHPRTHVIPLKEIKKNPTALHNTEYKKQQRKMMLEGTRPAECDYCWRVEDNVKHIISDRIYKSSEKDWAFPFIDDIVSKPWDDDVNPTYVEVNFSNVCNFKCSYCSPQFSSKWMEEINKFGAYPTSNKFNSLSAFIQQESMPIPHRDENHYIEAFWKWWPELYKDLQYFRITGGEPLLSKDTFDILDYIIENPNPNLTLIVNTNLNPPADVLNKFLEKIKIIVNEKKVKKFKIFTSCEAHGKQAEYIRYGLNYDKLIENINKVFSEVPIEITIMCTYNILSIFSYKDFLVDILAIKKKYKNYTDLRPALIVDIPYLRYPEHQSMFIGEDSMVVHFEETLNFMKQNMDPFKGFMEYEIDKFKRLYELFVRRQMQNDRLKTLRQDFVKFVDEHDLRRGTNFRKTFPQLNNFYNKIKRDMI